MRSESGPVRAAQAVGLFAVPLTCAVIVAAFLIPARSGTGGEDSLPQVVRGDGALAVAFGDARAVLGRAMVQKANSYFHGGVDIDCHVAHDERHEHHHHGVGCDCEACRHEHEEHEHHGSHDLWAWINSHVRAPQVHRHLGGEKAVELIPWFWAAVRADPHNVDAWTTAAYAADVMMKDKPLARRILAEARQKNPDSLELALFDARIVYDGGDGDIAEAERLLESARALGRRLCGGRFALLSEHDAETYCNILDYLSKILETRGDGAAIRMLLKEARATGSCAAAVESIARRAK